MHKANNEGSEAGFSYNPEDPSTIAEIADTTGKTRYVAERTARSASGISDLAETPERIYYEKLTTMAEKLTRSGLVGELDRDEKIRIYKEVKEKITDPKYEWNGENNTRIIGIVRDTRIAVQKEFGIESARELTLEARTEILRRIKAQLTGWVGERFSAEIPLRMAESKCISVEALDERVANPMEQGFGKYTHIRSVSEIFGGVRKDIILMGMHITHQAENIEYIDELSHKFELDKDNVQKILETASAVFFDYHQKERAYKTHTNTKFVMPREIVANELVHTLSNETPESKTKLSKQENKLLDQILEDAHASMQKDVFAKAESPSLLNTSQEILKDPELLEQAKETKILIDTLGTAEGSIVPIIENAARSSVHRLKEKKEKRAELLKRTLAEMEKGYFGITVPDGIVGDLKRISASVEVKFYSKEEVDDWIKTLEATITMKDPVQEGYIVNGLQVTTFKMVVQPTALTRKIIGPDILGERRFAQMNNKDAAITPVVVRLPNDITDEQFQKIYGIAQKKGITNFVLQRLPVTVKGVRKTTADIIKNDIYPFAQKQPDISRTDQDLLAELAKEETWE